jgi:hypothetical protein
LRAGHDAQSDGHDGDQENQQRAKPDLQKRKRAHTARHRCDQEDGGDDENAAAETDPESLRRHEPCEPERRHEQREGGGEDGDDADNAGVAPAEPLRQKVGHRIAAEALERRREQKRAQQQPPEQAGEDE